MPKDDPLMPPQGHNPAKGYLHPFGYFVPPAAPDLVVKEVATPSYLQQFTLHGRDGKPADPRDNGYDVHIPRAFTGIREKPKRPPVLVASPTNESFFMTRASLPAKPDVSTSHQSPVADQVVSRPRAASTATTAPLTSPSLGAQSGRARSPSRQSAGSIPANAGKSPPASPAPAVGQGAGETKTWVARQQTLPSSSPSSPCVYESPF